MNAGQLIDTVYPNSKAKRLQAGMEITLRQARRIVQTGKVPVKLLPSFLKALRQEHARNEAAMEALRLTLKAIEHAEMVDRAEARRAQSMGSLPQGADRLDERTTDSSLKKF